MLEVMDDATYTSGNLNGGEQGEGGGTIGGHFRHCIEFVDCCLMGIPTGKVDYNLRERDLLIETDRKYSIKRFSEAINRLESLPMAEAGKFLRVKPEDLGEIEADDFWCDSSRERELEFLQSHTIHHYALIAFKLRLMKFSVPPDFGVAPSTLRFWQAKDVKSKTAEKAF